MPAVRLCDHRRVKITAPCVVTLSWRLEDTLGNLIDELEAPVEFFYGGHDLFAKVEAELAGQEPGFQTRMQLEPEHAFGDYDAELVFFAQRSLFPREIEAGMQFDALPEGCETENTVDGAIYTVTEIYPEHVVLDGNHPLAGIALRLDLTVRDVRAASEAEIERGSLGEAPFSVRQSGADRAPRH